MASAGGWRALGSSQNDSSIFYSYLVERRTNQYRSTTPQAIVSWVTPYLKCNGTASRKEVQVNFDLTLRNQKELDDWLTASQKCGEASVFWINPQPRNGLGQTDAQTTGLDISTSDPLERQTTYTLYNVIKEKMPSVVIRDVTTGIPIAAPITAQESFYNSFPRK